MNKTKNVSLSTQRTATSQDEMMAHCNEPIVFEMAVNNFAETWEMAKADDEDAEYFTIGDIRESLGGCTPYATNIDPIDVIRTILKEHGIVEQYTNHSGVCYILRRVAIEIFINKEGQCSVVKKGISLF